MSTQKKKMDAAQFSTVILACVLSFMVGAVVFTLSAKTEMQRSFDAQLALLEEQHEQEIQDTIQSINEQFELERQSYQEALDDANDTIDWQQAQMERLFETNISDFYLARKYWYVFKDVSSDSGITMDVVKYLDDVCKEYDINPHWMWAIYWVESRWTTNIDNSKGSGARGLGQVMPDTGKYIWETVLGHEPGSFKTEMLYDPYVNIQITVALIELKLRDLGSMAESVRYYTGSSNYSQHYGIIAAAKQIAGIELSESTIHYQ